MSDLISRQMAIDVVGDWIYNPEDLRYHKDVINSIPAAQPEIVRCKDCKHWREGTAFSYCDKLYGMGVLDALDYMVAEDDYCSMAERRTDEE